MVGEIQQGAYPSVIDIKDILQHLYGDFCQSICLSHR